MRDQDFHDYRNGGEFSVFVKKTHREWFKLSKSLLTKFHEIPPSIDAEDLVQVMLLAATRFTFEWQPGRGPSLKTHVVWRAIDKALKALHFELKTGRVNNVPRSGSPRFARCFTSLVRNVEQDALVLKRIMPAVMPAQDQSVAFSEAISDPIVALFAESRDIGATTRRVLKDQSLRERYGITNVATAEKKVMSVVRARAAEVFA